MGKSSINNWLVVNILLMMMVNDDGYYMVNGG